MLGATSAGGSDQFSLPIHIVQEVDWLLPSKARMGPKEPCDDAVLGPRMPQQSGDTCDQLEPSGRWSFLDGPPLDLTLGAPEQGGECGLTHRRQGLKKAFHHVFGALSDPGDVTVHRISNDVTELLCVDQERVDRIERKLWIRLADVSDRIDDDAPELGKGPRVEVVLVKLVIELDQASRRLTKSINERWIDLVGLGGFADLPNEGLHEVGELYFKVLESIFGDGGHVSPMSLMDDMIATLHVASACRV
jgi:hypothetical protein